MCICCSVARCASDLATKATVHLLHRCSQPERHNCICSVVVRGSPFSPLLRPLRYNWVTGESTWTKPAGWKIKQDEIWVKNQDSKGNVYYFNQLTMETKWMPPCNICNKEMGKRICATCDFCVYCVSCYENEHEKMAGGTDHVWKAADIDKEKLKSGERYGGPRGAKRRAFRTLYTNS